MRYGIHIDYFGNPVLADLKRNQRTEMNVLRALAAYPRVSTWDMSDNYKWLPGLCESLEKRGLVTNDRDEPFPWIRYTLTDAGRAALLEAAGLSEKEER